MDTELQRIVRQSGLLDALVPREQERLLQAVRQTIGPLGEINPNMARPFKASQVMQWDPGNTGRQRVGTAGQVIILAAYAATPPSTGDAVVTLTHLNELTSEETLATVTIPQGASFSSFESLVGCPSDVLAGAWLGASVSTANGASGVSISVTIRPA